MNYCLAPLSTTDQTTSIYCSIISPRVYFCWLRSPLSEDYTVKLHSIMEKDLTRSFSLLVHGRCQIIKLHHNTSPSSRLISISGAAHPAEVEIDCDLHSCDIAYLIFHGK